jgi:hypothetical protein
MSEDRCYMFRDQCIEALLDACERNSNESLLLSLISILNTCDEIIEEWID